MAVENDRSNDTVPEYYNADDRSALVGGRCGEVQGCRWNSVRIYPDPYTPTGTVTLFTVTTGASTVRSGPGYGRAGVDLASGNATATDQHLRFALPAGNYSVTGHGVQWGLQPYAAAGTLRHSMHVYGVGAVVLGAHARRYAGRVQPGPAEYARPGRGQLQAGCVGGNGRGGRHRGGDRGQRTELTWCRTGSGTRGGWTGRGPAAAGYSDGISGSGATEAGDGAPGAGEREQQPAAW